jgi:putative Mg2+ transporter-C (MgtC) family protein
MPFGIDPHDLEYTGRILLAALLTGLVGIERQRSGHDAGLRTIMLVGISSALFTILSMHAFGPGTGDPSRVASQIVVGVGFLGAGVLIRQGTTVRNLTTAATIWTSAALGTAVGTGWYWIAISTTIIVLIVLTVLQWFEPHLAPPNPRISAKTSDTIHPQPNLGTSPRMGWVEDAPEKNYEPPHNDQ